MTFWLLFIHILGASIWVGGHLLLAIRYLPRAVLKKEIAPLTQFEEKFEVVGIPALLAQVITGIIMAMNIMPISNWLNFSNPISRLILLKLSMLLATFFLAVDARLRVIPKLSADTVNSLAWHVIAVTCISLVFVALGLSFRFGGI